MPPGHSWLQKCICEERLRTENATFWAPSIFQKLWALDLRFVDPVGSPSDLWFCIKTFTKSIKSKKLNECLWKLCKHDLHFRDAQNPLKRPPGHSCLRKCICEERLSTENVAFWAPSIFQKLRVPDWRVSDSIDSRSNLWFSINISMKNRRKSINGMLAGFQKAVICNCICCIGVACWNYFSKYVG